MICNIRIFYTVTYGHAHPPRHHIRHLHLFVSTVLWCLLFGYLNILQNFETGENYRAEEILRQRLGHADLLTYVPNSQRSNRKIRGDKKKGGEWVRNVDVNVLLGMYRFGGMIAYALHIQRAEQTV